MKFNHDHSIDYAIVLANKKTGDKEGRILGYYTGEKFHAFIELYIGNSFDGVYHSGAGTAGGYGYNKESSAIADALHACKIATKSDADPALASSAAHFTGHKYTDAQVARICKRDKIIPVYAGTGNHESAFSVFFNVVSVKW
jgi:hypothetical protein